MRSRCNTIRYETLHTSYWMPQSFASKVNLSLTHHEWTILTVPFIIVHGMPALPKRLRDFLWIYITSTTITVQQLRYIYSHKRSLVVCHCIMLNFKDYGQCERLK